MDSRLRFFMLVSEHRMIIERMKIQLKKNGKICKYMMIVENAFATEINKCVDNAISAAMEREPNGIDAIYRELNLTSLKRKFENE